MKSFKSLGVCDELIQALQKQGIKEPTPIQEQAIPVVFKGNDVIAKAQTGTGKTLAFLLPILQRVHTDVHQEQVLIIAPTRELVKQISDEAKEIGSILNVDILPLIGGKTIEGKSSESLLTSLERAGVRVNVCCRSGECSLCRVKLESGKVFMPRGALLRYADEKFGYIHSCKAYPISDVRLSF